MVRILAAVTCLFIAAPALATDMETMICKNGIVSKGDLAIEVVAKCGEPAQKAQREEKRGGLVRDIHGRERTVFSLVTIDDWTFNFGPHEFMQRLLFENGRVVGIESLGYGF
ncbi:DUF2845 domain-containing protein [Geobacter sp. DSM 9736]|uniref:DUF2845 domain-containing protein n=1 Tax=Geobacter sp. DSM 9736 TaxID=1277350 RepID=UPI000B6061EF|nr:DUF2845 domain-containing protein [Geobacter sp. DSM 9736]SNB46551.1 Protein of unknown function [Geobacter sp. DSM 9736]